MSKSESKYFNTARRMDEAFLELINKKDFEYITVKEICEKAEVNRSTFYLHYETMEDLLRESVEYHQQSLSDYVGHDLKTIGERIQNDSLDALYFVTNEYLEPYLKFIKDNKELFKAVLKHPNVFHSVDTFKKMSEYVFIPVMDRFNVPQNEQKYMLQFHIQGLIGIVSAWLKKDCEDSIEDIIEVMQKCVNKIDNSYKNVKK